MAWGVPTAKELGALMAEDAIRRGNVIDDNKVIIGVDKANGEDTTVVGICDGKTFDVIGESVELTISTGPWKSKTIQAIQINDLAIYFGDEPDIGLVIHVPTLTKFDRAIPDGEWTQEQLIQWCWKVQQECLPQWECLRTYKNANYKFIDKNVTSIILAKCLSINPGD